MLFGMTACDAADEAATPEDTSGPAETAESNILIAYFTWADNTVVEDEEAALQSALSHYESVGDRTNYDEGMPQPRPASLLPEIRLKWPVGFRNGLAGSCFPL